MEATTEVYHLRDAKWEADLYVQDGEHAEVATPKATASEASGVARSKKRVRAEEWWADTLRNGKKLCEEYQKKRCLKNCPKPHLHKCAHIIRRSGHVCGGSHPASECEAGAKFIKSLNS